jgi:ribosomal protein S27E
MENDYEQIEQESTRRESDIKCPNCAATITYDPALGKIVCDYCGYACDVPPAEEGKGVAELAFEVAKHTESFEWGADKKLVRCKSCGAEAVYDRLAVADICPYCGATHVMEQADEASLAPGGVWPFELTDEVAGKNFKPWTIKKWFVPNKAKKMAQAGQMKGVYVPVWTFDANTTSNYTASAGHDYTVKQGDHYVTHTRWVRVSGIYQQFIDDQIVFASKRYDERMMEGVKPFALERSKVYNPEYLMGFIAERYSVGLEEGWGKARVAIDKRLKNEIAATVKAQQHADRVSNVCLSTIFSNITYKYLLLPLWMSSFTYKDKLFRFMVNGQTGRVNGKAPISPLKVTFFVLAILIIVVILALLFSRR